MKVLIIDDSVATIDTFRALLTCEGHVVYTATTAEGGLIELNGRPEIDLVIVDLYLPLMDGLSFCVEVRKLGHALPIVLLTAAPLDVVEGLKARVESLGNITVLRKPTDPALILHLIKNTKVTKRVEHGLPADHV